MQVKKFDSYEVEDNMEKVNNFCKEKGPDVKNIRIDRGDVYVLYMVYEKPERVEVKYTKTFPEIKQ